MSNHHHEMPVSPDGRVTIPEDLRHRLGVAQGGAVEFVEVEGVVTVRPAQRVTLSELLAGFDPARHRHGPEERPWDDDAQGGETL